MLVSCGAASWSLKQPLLNYSFFSMRVRAAEAGLEEAWEALRTEGYISDSLF